MSTLNFVPQVHQVHDGARVSKISAPERPQHFYVRTAEPRWRYALSFALDTSTDLTGIGELRVVVDLEVETGAVGVGCTNADFSAYVDREIFVSPGVRHKVYVPIGAPGAASHLVLRNVSPDGSSAMHVYGIVERRVTAAEEIVEKLRFSGPIGPAVVHNAAAAKAFGPRVSLGGFQPVMIETDEQESSNAVSFDLTIGPELGGAGMRRVTVELEVEVGSVGIGCMTADYSGYVDREVFMSSGIKRKVYVPVGPLGAANQLMFRNVSRRGRSVVRVHDIAINRVEADQERRDEVKHSLWNAPLMPPLRYSGESGAGEKYRRTLVNLRAVLGEDVSRITFPIAVAHTSREWDWERCTQEFLRNRYTRPGRLKELPPFQELPPAQGARSHTGHLTLFDLTLDGDGITLAATRCIDSQDKIQDACRMGRRLVICLEDYVIVHPADTDDVAIDSELERIDDPWFAGLHTVFPVDDSRCVISASAPDAILLLDIKQRRVVWRWRVPADRYGRNYELTDSMSVQDHHIANDLQLAHLNCAFPDGDGGFWISTLGQGDIAHVSASGAYELLATGFVGCHGLRYSQELSCLYFSDSCNGRLISIGHDRVAKTIGTVESYWLHDAQHLAGDIFVLCLGDKNLLVLLDAASNNEVARFDMRARGQNVQFVGLTGSPTIERSKAKYSQRT